MFRIRHLLAFSIATLTAMPLVAEEFTPKVTKENGKAAITKENGGGLKENDVTDVSGTEDVKITVTCASADLCQGLTVNFGGKDVCTAAGTSCTGTIAKTDVKLGKLIVSSGNTSIFSTTLKLETAGTDTTSTKKIALSEMLRTPCKFRLPSGAPGGAYNRAASEAYFVTDVLGNVKIAPIENVDEDDRIHVIVYGDTRLLPLLHVFRKSAIRTLGTVNLAGSGLTVSVPADPAHAITESKQPQCGFQEFILTAFASGKGEVEIDVHTDEQPEAVGSFEFLVDKLYDGILSSGVAHSSLSDTDFKLVTQGDKKVIFATEEDGSNEYAVFLSAFLHRRDLEKPAERTIDLFAPTIGISMKHPADHAYVGVSVNWKLVVLTAGEHFAHVTTLSKASKLHEGDVFVGADTDLPRAKKWRAAPFVSLSMDLRAITQFFATLGGGGGTGH